MVDYAAEYRRLHENEKHFRGSSMIKHVETIAELVEAHKASTLLDYGCGKGQQYTHMRVHERFGILSRLYDVGVRELSNRPDTTFDGVICTDVMEHIEEADISGILKDVGGFAKPGGFVFFSIDCAPAKNNRKDKGKMLSDGRNVHLTVKPPEWWNEQLSIIEHAAVHVAYENAE